MPRRRLHIQGAEKEYGIVPNDLFANVARYGRRAAPFLLRHAPILPMYDRLIDVNQKTESVLTDVFLQNMGRLYIDTGDHPEYSTPECATARDSVIWQKAGDRILANAIDDMNTRVWDAITGNGTQVGIPGHTMSTLLRHIMKYSLKPGSEIIRIYRNSIDSRGGASFGDHENHIARRDINIATLNNVLFLHLISRVIWQGSGCVRYRMGKIGFQYTLSQRESVTGLPLCTSGTTSTPRPLVNSRDEPHADREKWRRIHIIGSDANLAEVATRLKYGTIMLLVLMTEGGFFFGKTLEDDEERLLKAYRHFNRDLTFRESCPLMNGEYSALDVQRLLWSWAAEFFSSKKYTFLGEEIQWQLEWWKKVLDAASSENPMGALVPFADHAAKYALITRDMEKYGYSWSDNPKRAIKIGKSDGSAVSMNVESRIRYWDLEYHRISNRSGLFQKLSSMERVCSDDEIEYAMKYPPPNTRACARRAYADIMERHYPKIRISAIDWECIRAKGIDGKNFDKVFLDPFSSRLNYKEIPLE